MRRVVGVVLAGLLMTLGLVSPAGAATHRRPPSAPRHVVVSSVGQPEGSVRVSWTAPKHENGAAVEVYAVTVVRTASGARPVWRVVVGTQRSVVLAGLAVDRRYTVRVAAYNRLGRGPWASVTVRTPHAPAVFAVDEQAHTLVRVDPSGRAAPKVVLAKVTDVSDLAVDPSGNAYVAAAGSVTKVPRHGKTVVLGAATQVETDAAGDVYLGGSAGVVEITPAGARSTVTTNAADQMLVDAAGAVTLVKPAFYSTFTLTTYASGAAPAVRTFDDVSNSEAVLGDRLGTVYVETNSGGGARFDSWNRIGAGATSADSLGTREAEYGPAVAPDNRFFLAQTVRWCPALNQGTCTPDLTVADVARYAPDGTLLGTIPVTGLTAREGAGIDITVDATGGVWAADRSAKPGLVKVPPAGGAAVRVADGTFDWLTFG